MRTLIRFLTLAVIALNVTVTTAKAAEQSLKDAVAEFNSKIPTVRKDEPKLTEEEVIASLRTWDRKRDPVEDATLFVFQEIARTGLLPEGAKLTFTTSNLAQEFLFDVWWIDLSIPTGPETGYTHRIRVRTLNSHPLTPEERKQLEQFLREGDLGEAVAPPAQSSIVAGTEDIELATKLLGEWRRERDRLITGVAAIKTTGFDFHPRTKERIESESQIATAFDWKQNHFRFDRRYGRFGGQFIRTPLITVNRRLPDGSPIPGPADGTMNDHVAAFDVRLIGITTGGEQVTLRSSTLDDIANRFGTERKLEEISRLADGRYRIRWGQTTEQISARFTIWLNQKRGATPEEFQMHVRLPGESDWRLDNHILTEWSEMDGVYVPVRCEETRFVPQYGSSRYSHSITWKTVNKPVHPQTFQADDLSTFLGDAETAAMPFEKNPYFFFIGSSDVAVTRVGGNALENGTDGQAVKRAEDFVMFGQNAPRPNPPDPVPAAEKVFVFPPCECDWKRFLRWYARQVSLKVDLDESLSGTVTFEDGAFKSSELFSVLKSMLHKKGYRLTHEGGNVLKVRLIGPGGALIQEEEENQLGLTGGSATSESEGPLKRRKAQVETLRQTGKEPVK